jgi:hypothetical protein
VPYLSYLKEDMMATKAKIKKCNDRECTVTDDNGTLEASGYCFNHAEELACLLAEASEEFHVSLDIAALAYGKPKKSK